MGYLNEKFDKLFSDIHQKLDNLLHEAIKHYGEKLDDEWWYLDTLELRLFYDGEQTKVKEYEYIVTKDDDDIEEKEWEEDSSGNFKRHTTMTKTEYLEKIDEYIFEKQSLDKKVTILTEILK